MLLQMMLLRTKLAALMYYWVNYSWTDEELLERNARWETKIQEDSNNFKRDNLLWHWVF